MTSAAVTPMMAQFLEIKAEYPDALLFYRMGDFYEMFFDDAVAAASALDITLTKRGKHQDQDIPMCGVPYHAAEGYLLTLIRRGFRVAVCEQMEKPAEAKKRGAKSVVKREVVRLVTPGTLTEDSLLEARSNNFLASYAQIRDVGALAWVDISTGAIFSMPCPLVKLGPELSRISPSELIVAEGNAEHIVNAATDSGTALTHLAGSSFDSDSSEKRILKFYKTETLDGFGEFTRAEVSALGALIDYLEITQKGNLPLLKTPERELPGGAMEIDSATRLSLELVRGSDGTKHGSLLSAIDRTVTAGGGRMLLNRLSSPSCDASVIAGRLDSVDALTSDAALVEQLVDELKSAHDMDRAISRLALGRGGPRDMVAIRTTLHQAEKIQAILKDRIAGDVGDAASSLAFKSELRDLLDVALVDEPPLLARDGGFIAKGFDQDLDGARQLRDEGKSVIAGLQSKYIEITEIPKLKIKHNNVLGYFIETTAAHAEQMLSQPLSDQFIHRQTTASAVRFTTVELNEMESRILNAGGHALEIENRLYSELCDAILTDADKIGAMAMALSKIDVSVALADLANAENWVKPILDNSRDFEISGGRHPVVEAALKASANPFVANDCDLSDTNIWLLTGPNMAGKSTFLRQNALIAILAQMGSFVPATSAKFGLVSQVFSRVGASDDLARGRSTFMVEMVETAAILNQADDRALVILDEIGRGTATYDGLSIAWATLEHLHDVNKCRALFATHYHEMAALADRLDGVGNATVAVREWEGDVVFLHEVQRGTADRSYGVQVAKLAGLPESVVARARVVLDALEKGEREGKQQSKALIDDLPLFSASLQAPIVSQKSSAVEDALSNVLPDELSPKEALDLVYELRRLLAGS